MAKRYHGNGTPFSRAQSYRTTLFAVLSAMGGSIHSPAASSIAAAVAQIGDYASRGHGKSRNTGLTLAKVHRFRYNKYSKPHQGAQETARRKLGGSKPIPRRLWSDVIAVIAEPETLGYVEATTRKGVAIKALFHGVKETHPVLGVQYG